MKTFEYVVNPTCESTISFKCNNTGTFIIKLLLNKGVQVYTKYFNCSVKNGNIYQFIISAYGTSAVMNKFNTSIHLFEPNQVYNGFTNDISNAIIDYILTENIKPLFTISSLSPIPSDEIICTGDTNSEYNLTCTDLSTS